MDRITFSVNGDKCSVGSEVDSDTSLNDYIRNHLNLRGTKYMCKEGGCGACVVAVTVCDPHRRTFSVNSCLVSVTSCQDWEIMTVEGIGDRARGYHPVQKTLAEYNGTQCGYCSPGFVMSMYSLLEANKYDLTQYEIENSFGSNTCRCTGSRPILDAFKSFAKDAPKPPPKLEDIEDLHICKKEDCHKCEEKWCMVNNDPPHVKKIHLKDGHVWYRVNEINEIFDILDEEGCDSYMLVNGNTGREKKGSSVEVTPEQFLSLDMTGRVITHVKVPPLSQRYQFVSFKIMARAQNAHAQVNAAFLYEFDDHNKDIVLSARIVFGGLSGKFVHARETEDFVCKKKIFTNQVLQQALKILEGELIVEEIAGEMKPEYRKKCALGLFYKGLLVLIPQQKLKPWYRSGARDLRKTRPLSKGSQVYDTNPITWPVNEPMPKIEALIQCAGEAFYSNDLVTQPKEVYCAFVTSDICTGDIESIDPTPALKIPGVLAFFSAKDIPGKNSFLSQRVPSQLVPEEVFAEKTVKYYDQPIGLIVAETERLANRAALLVKVNYRVDKRKPILTINDARERDPSRVSLFVVFPARDRGLNVQRVMKGSDDIYAQYHYTMETQTTVTKPNEEGIDVIASTQWIDTTHIGISEALNIEQNRINLIAPRCGGGYGGRISRANHVAVACSLVTHLMDRPCRFVMSIQANLRVVGKRLPCTRDFEVGVNDSGEIQYLEYHLYEDNGYIVSDPVAALLLSGIKNCYDNRRWQYKIFNVTTDTPSNTYNRAPGTMETISMTEQIMERISYELERDPVQVRRNNLQPAYTEVQEMIQTLLRDGEYEKRKAEVQQFNKLNRWKKRGLRVAFMSWPVPLLVDYHVLLTVYHGDGSVVVHHAGIEIGQGINTKVIQAVAYTLNIPIEKVRCKVATASTTPNSFTVGSSRTTQSVCFGAIKCCQIILDRISAIRDTLTDPTWEILVETAFNRGINLQSSYRVTSNDQVPYRSGGVALAEVELDILTGEHDILRVDIVEDVGTSINPELDIGQVEGAFMMGVGYWTHEELIFDEKTGELLTDRTWYYKVPLTKDIPIDFRIQLRRNSYNPVGTLGARAVAEPPTCLSICVAFALREAIASSRENTGYPRNEWFKVVGSEVDSDTSLNDYIRNHLNLRGTKYMCKEGGCGACVVAVTVCDPHRRTFSVNSCLVSVTSCQDWEITTVEGIGNRARGYHPVQKTLAEYNGTQCGYCSPGFVMSMYSLLEANKYNLTQYEIENSFGSNTCRCTGSRPILDAFKSFAKDAPKPPPKIEDIEDLHICKKEDCQKCEEKWCVVSDEPPHVKKIPLKDGHVWYRVNEIHEIFDILDVEGYDSYMLVNGNTGRVHKGTSVEVTPEQFLSLDMTGRVIAHVKIPPLSQRYQFVSFKIMPRAQNAHAQVNAAFLYEFDDHEKDIVLSARIVIGGLSGKFVHARETEEFLCKKKIFTNQVLQQALRILEGELIVEEIAGEMKPEYRKKCALGLFYKGLLVLIPQQKLKPWYRSGARDLRKTRPLSKGSQVYDTNPIIWPVTEPMPKVEALIQCAGESFYTNDLVTQPKEVYCAFVTSDICTGEIESIDPTPALLVPEEVFAEKTVKYYDQPIGLIVAETERLANRAALLVKVNYRVDKRKPILTINDAREKDPSRVSLFIVFPARDRGLNVQRVLKGSDDIYAQYHYTMETQSAVTRPGEAGVDVVAATQWLDSTQIGIAEALKIEQNRVNLIAPRCGGAYGAKINRVNHVAVASALVTYLMDRPCRFVMSIQANLRVVGKRLPCTRDFEVGINDSGEIQYLEYHMYEDNGYVVSDPVSGLVLSAIKNCYDNRRWQYKIFNVTTDTPSNTYKRAPGTLEAIAMTEQIMERISYELDRDPIQIRQTNIQPAYTEVQEMIQTLLKDGEYEKRKQEVQQFNKLNRWKKRGLRVAFMSWPVPVLIDYHVLLTVYHGDGSVVVQHAGVDIGQGINTKVIQTVAYTLKIPIEKVRCAIPTAATTPNSFAVGGSRTTQSVCFGVIKCCQIILDRISAVRDTLNDPTWELLVETAFNRGINLQSSYRVTSNDQVPYRCGGVALAEVELDILTGEHDILRVDIVEDVGTSINPELDIGQIEGAFVMGVGYWTHEELIFDEKTGELLTDRTWYYKVPLTKDIPIDFRIQLRRNSYNPVGTLGARAVAEPPTCLSICVAFALREAIVSSREDSGYPRNKWFKGEEPSDAKSGRLDKDGDDERQCQQQGIENMTDSRSTITATTVTAVSLVSTNDPIDPGSNITVNKVHIHSV
ncbi:unnamed protein product [Chrysodeixis includens]|uniref:2Fe-2S ferredoxin-type domain-containing protein n=1 Tax=Chrysodeixis includens TaxID=689277 RepID=A0A9P0BVW9_CHRIL|nr:unnamed protein product [Chrysodeixis includens]